MSLNPAEHYRSNKSSSLSSRNHRKTVTTYNLPVNLVYKAEKIENYALSNQTKNPMKIIHQKELNKTQRMDESKAKSIDMMMK